MSQDQAVAIGRMFRKIIRHYLNLIEDVSNWQEHVRHYRGEQPLDRAVREAISRLWHMRRPEDVLEQISQFRRSYGGMAPLLAGNPEDKSELQHASHHPACSPPSDSSLPAEIKAGKIPRDPKRRAGLAGKAMHEAVD